MIHDKPAISGNPAANGAATPPAPRPVATPAAAPATNLPVPPPNPTIVASTALLARLAASTPVLQAQVLDQSTSGLVRLQVGAQVLKAQLPNIRLQPGDSLPLQLLSLDKVPQLKILALPSASPPELRLLRQLLPREGDFQQLFRQLDGLPRGQTPTSAPATAPTAPTSQPLPQLVELLTSQVLTPERISPQAVEDLIRASGLFLESRLASTARAEPKDLKAALLRLVALLQPGGSDALLGSSLGTLFQRLFKGARAKADQPATLPLDPQDKALRQLRQAAEGALAKVEIRQLNSLPQQDETRSVWQFGLPLREQDQVRDLEIQIERERARNVDGENDLWTVNLHFDFDGTGALDVRLNLKQDAVTVAFWAQRPRTLEEIRDKLPRLKDQLEKARLRVQQLNLYPGAMPRQRKHPVVPENGLLHELA